MKKMIFKTLLIFITTFLSLHIYGQQKDHFSAIREVQEDLLKIKAEQGGIFDEKLISPNNILFRKKGEVCKIFNNNKIYKINNVNFNFVSNKFFLRESENNYYIIEPSLIDSLYLGNKIFVKRKIRKREKFVELLYKVKETFFYKDYSGELVKGRINPLSGAKETDDRYRKVIKYFIEKNGDQKKIKLRKKILLQTYFNDKKKQVEKYSKKNKLSFKKEKDLVKILNYYNSL